MVGDLIGGSHWHMPLQIWLPSGPQPAQDVHPPPDPQLPGTQSEPPA